jgi:hypothetical protein
MNELDEKAARVIPWLWPEMWQPGQKCEHRTLASFRACSGLHDIPCPPWTAELMERAMEEKRISVYASFGTFVACVDGHLFAHKELHDLIPRFAVLKALDELREQETTNKTR